MLYQLSYGHRPSKRERVNTMPFQRCHEKSVRIRTSPGEG